MTIRSALYRRSMGSLFSRFAARRMPEAQGRLNRQIALELKGRNDSSPGLLWFHAASVGELECLWPVVIRAAKEKSRLVLTVFSDSATNAVQKLAEEARVSGASVLFAGRSPWEGEWNGVFSASEALRPSCFVTAKYEAWPELWMTLSHFSVPLVLAAARARGSLRVARSVLRATGVALPRLTLLPVYDDEAPALRAIFPEAQVQATGDPRWDRVRDRALMARSQGLLAEELRRAEGRPRPWGVLGSVWPQDFERLGAEIQKTPGTLWIVPHRVDAESLRHLGRAAEASGFRLSSHILIAKMGILAELYSVADWAYVGGGFGDGIHSTIEPALFGLPVAAGPKNAEKFPEIGAMRSSGQVTLLADGTDFEAWRKVALEGPRREWKSWTETQFGATERVYSRVAALSSAGSNRLKTGLA